MGSAQQGWNRATTLLCTIAILWIVCKSADGAAVMSIDFGSEWLKVAIVKPGVPMEIVLNRESKRKTSAAVFLKGDERLFGDEAAASGVRFPKNAYIHLQQVIGKQFDGPHVELYKKRFPYYDLVKDVVRGTVLFQHDSETAFSPEELLGMIFKHCQEIAEAYADHPIKDTVITVPAFFNQAERRAMIDAATLAGLKVLQLINDNTAVALNYGVFRRAEFNGTATSVMFYDVGASSTTATIVSYQTTKVKEQGIAETVPQLTIRGIGYDPFLGGLEFDFRLQDHFAKSFKEQGKAKSDVTQSPRAMAKLLKEAKRVKKVLSANTDHISQVEGLIDDIDFKLKVTREEFESMCGDLFDRVRGPVDQALASSEMILSEIDQIILVGGGTRVPKLQEKLLEAVKRSELGKNINTDEAAAMGAVYVSAFLSKSFRVKKFVIKDANLFPIQVSFNREQVSEDGEPSIRRVTRTLFGVGNPFPLKKVMTFNKHTKDFFFNVDYGDISFLPKMSQNALGPLNLTQVSLYGVENAFLKHKDMDDEPKGIKAHFRMDGGGLLFLDKVEAVFERPPEEEKAEEEKSTFEKLSNTISNLFGSSDDSTTEAPTEPPTEAAEEVDSDDTSETDQSSSESKQPDDDSADKEKSKVDDGSPTKETEETESEKETENEAVSEEMESKDGEEETGNGQSEGDKTEDDGEKAGDEEKTSDKEPETKEDDKDSIDAKSTDTDPKDNSNTSNKTADSTTPNTTVNTTDTESKNKTKKSTPKPTVMRENIEINVMVLDVMLPTETHLVDWKQRQVVLTLICEGIFNSLNQP
jgi:hypoxia up-regulated 1